jgi:hypothetical protein
VIQGTIIGRCVSPGRGILFTVEAADGSEASIRVEMTQGAMDAQVGDAIDIFYIGGGERAQWAPKCGGAWKSLTPRQSEPDAAHT